MRRAVLGILIFFILVWVVIGTSIAHYGAFSAEAFLALPIGALALFFGIRLMRSGQDASDKETMPYERLRSMLDNLPVGVYRATSDGRILEANRTFAELLGYDNVDEIKSVNLDDVYVRKADRINHLEKLRDAPVFAEFELKRKDGRTIWVRDYPKATLANSGYVDYMDGVLVQTQGIEAIVRDLTERRRLEIMKDHFISAATHELRTPLVSIKGYADFILAENPDSLIGNIRPYVEVMKRNADRLLELTNDLLDVQRMESGRVQLKLQQVDIRSLVRECVQEVQPLLNQKSHHLHMMIPSGALNIRGDPLRLSQVLWNIMNNAIKFTPDGGDVTVSIEETPARIRICVQDTGIGIDKKDLDRVFEPFATIEKPTYFKGTGLGLSLTKRLVEAHGGIITVTSPGKFQGTTVTLELSKDEVLAVAK
jgi:two-component system phosphate regulon sensor histidine kinase PhoR